MLRRVLALRRPTLPFTADPGLSVVAEPVTESTSAGIGMPFKPDGGVAYADTVTTPKTQVRNHWKVLHATVRGPMLSKKGTQYYYDLYTLIAPCGKTSSARHNIRGRYSECEFKEGQFVENTGDFRRSKITRWKPSKEEVNSFVNEPTYGHFQEPEAVKLTGVVVQVNVEVSTEAYAHYYELKVPNRTGPIYLYWLGGVQEPIVKPGQRVTAAVTNVREEQSTFDLVGIALEQIEVTGAVHQPSTPTGGYPRHGNTLYEITDESGQFTFQAKQKIDSGSRVTVDLIPLGFHYYASTVTAC